MIEIISIVILVSLFLGVSLVGSWIIIGKEARDRIQTALALFYGKNVSLDRKLRGARAVIHFLEGKQYGSSIKVEKDGMIYYFEGEAKFEEYKNAEGKNVVRKELKYGGWEMDMQHNKNKLFAQEKQ